MSKSTLIVAMEWGLHKFKSLAGKSRLGSASSLILDITVRTWSLEKGLNMHATSVSSLGLIVHRSLSPRDRIIMFLLLTWHHHIANGLFNHAAGGQALQALQAL